MDNYLDSRKARVEEFKKTIRKKCPIPTKVGIPEGLFMKCDICNEHIYHEDLIKNQHVCPKCKYHFRITARQRLLYICDEKSFEEQFENIVTVNPLDFPNYEDKITKYQCETNEIEAFICGVACIDGSKAAIGVLDSFFMMGSMGSVVGEKITRITEYATSKRLPLVLFSASGGARMQEGLFSLMQMAKTSAAISLHQQKGLLYISVLTNPTTGGVAASYASLGDVMIAEYGALIGFAGQRVIKQTINEELPEGFQTAKFQLSIGAVDMVVERNKLKATLSTILKLHSEVLV